MMLTKIKIILTVKEFKISQIQSIEIPDFDYNG